MAKVKGTLLGSLLAAAALAAGPARAIEVDAIAAKVGSETVLRSDVLSEMARAGADPSRYAEFRDQLIERKLILKAAADAKMTLQDWMLDNRVREIVKRTFDGDRNKLMDALARQKLSYAEWFQHLKDDMVVSAMRWNVIDKNVSASPQALKAEYADHPERYGEGRKATVSVILLKPEDAAKRADVDAALKTQKFPDVARHYSTDVHAADGGLWRDVTPNEVFKPEICEELDRTAVGATTRWITLDGWNFLIRKESETPGKTMSFEEAFDRVEANVKDELAAKAYTAWIERLKAATYIKICEGAK